VLVVVVVNVVVPVDCKCTEQIVAYIITTFRLCEC